MQASGGLFENKESRRRARGEGAAPPRSQAKVLASLVVFGFVVAAAAVVVVGFVVRWRPAQEDKSR